MGRIFLILVLVMLILPIAEAKRYHVKLLAVKESPAGVEGSTADLYLEIKQGDGRVFLETFPLTKIDTQISTRFARDVACDFLNVDCDNNDFFYTISADSSIIGGPSAGAAIAALTVVALKDIELDEGIAVTGTINSGGLIGPIGGVKEKVQAAKDVGLKKVIIPSGERFVKPEGDNSSENRTIDIVEYGRNISIEVVEAGSLDDVLWHFTKKRLKRNFDTLKINDFYSGTMRELSLGLCNRSVYLRELVLMIDSNIYLNESNASFSNAEDLIRKGNAAFNNSRYYAAGSYCFGANVRLGYVYLLKQNLSERKIEDVSASLKNSIDAMNKELESVEIKTITDLESYMAVKERIVEAEDLLEKSKSSGNIHERLSRIAFASERINSAVAWMRFLDNKGKVFDFNDDLLEQSCKRKLSEVEEYFQYVSSELPLPLTNIKEDIDSAYKDIEKKNFVMCLFKASKSKSELTTLQSTLTLDVSQIDNFINQKLLVIKRNIAEESTKGVFPILGYSYYEYADSLKESDKYSSLLYAGYALELSNLDIYFKEKQKIYLFNLDSKTMIIFVSSVVGAFAAGIVVAGIYYRGRKSDGKK